MAQWPELPRLPNLPGLPKLPTLPQTPAAPAPRGGASSPEDAGLGASATRVLGCGVGGVAGAFLAKHLARLDAQRRGLSGDAAKQRERGYVLGLALAGCGGGSVIAGTAYAKLSEAGRKSREQELAEAARSAQPRTYTDPENAALTGRVTPGPAYADADHRECRDIEDVLADQGKGEPAIVKYCRLADGGWGPVAT